jgi:hypothetical protein
MRVAIVAKPKRVRLVLVLGICGWATLDKERNAPFCLPARDLTTQEINFMFARIKADIRGIIRDNMDDIIAGVVLTKAYRCGH